MIGSVSIEPQGWKDVAQDGALRTIPTNGPPNLDTRELRGRRIDPGANIRFGSWRSQVFILLGRDGRILCGGRPGG